MPRSPPRHLNTLIRAKAPQLNYLDPITPTESNTYTSGYGIPDHRPHGVLRQIPLWFYCLFWQIENKIFIV
jgi:hypothetical protein